MLLCHLFPGWAQGSAGPRSVKPQLPAHTRPALVCLPLFSNQIFKARHIPLMPRPSVWTSLCQLIATFQSFLTARLSNLELASAQGQGTSRAGLSPLSHTSPCFLCFTLTSSLGRLQRCPVPMTVLPVESVIKSPSALLSWLLFGSRVSLGEGQALLLALRSQEGMDSTCPPMSASRRQHVLVGLAALLCGLAVSADSSTGHRCQSLFPLDRSGK